MVQFSLAVSTSIDWASLETLSSNTLVFAVGVSPRNGQLCFFPFYLLTVSFGIQGGDQTVCPVIGAPMQDLKVANYTKVAVKKGDKLMCGYGSNHANWDNGTKH